MPRSQVFLSRFNWSFKALEIVQAILNSTCATVYTNDVENYIWLFQQMLWTIGITGYLFLLELLETSSLSW